MNPTHDRDIRTRLLALAALLLVLWSYAAYLTSRDTADMLRVRAVAGGLGQPADRLILALQAERRLTIGAIARAEPPITLAGVRAGTDRAVAGVETGRDALSLRLLGGGEARNRADELAARLRELGGLRSRIDDGQVDWADAAARYDGLVDAAFAVYGPAWSTRESELATETRAVVALARARELLARQDTVLTGALAGGLAPEDRRHLAGLVAIQRHARAEAAAQLPADGRDDYRRLVESPRFSGLLLAEDRLTGTDATPTEEAWRSGVEPALGGLDEVVRSAARRSVERAGVDAAIALGWAGAVVGLGLITVLGVLWGWARAVRPLTGTASGATSAPRELFLQLTRRNQGLLRAQLDLLDEMERRDRAPEDAADLFRLDHLTTRIRRNVEKLVTLAGGTPARRWRRPVPLLDVARGAMAEVPDYERVLVAPHWPWELAGPAATDVVHLLAELIENALAFSPANTTVRVTGVPAGESCRVVVTDDGPGLPADLRAELEGLLADPPPDVPPGRAGLYAAAHLAARCGATISLCPGRRGGTEAVVDLPASLVTPVGAPARSNGRVPQPTDRSGAPDQPPDQPPGRAQPSAQPSVGPATVEMPAATAGGPTDPVYATPAPTATNGDAGGPLRRP
ncbi:nitrate- and nitrite sensing domain-containing protein [Micromonospora sp. H33]|uniref:sensor histidine kinase n=1 Tax=Micromonospora sp. H33 TaxID=3452215 RepID=UPI003F8ADD3A